MSDVTHTDLTDEWARTDRTAYFEQRLFVLSPLSDALTAFIIFAILLGSFFVIAWAEGVTLFTRTAVGIAATSPMQTAFALSLTLGVALYIQRYTRVRERQDHPAFARTLNPGAIEKHNVGSLTPANVRLTIPTTIGFFGGIAASWILFFHYLSDASGARPALFGWFLIVTTILGMSFTRGVELSRTGTQGVNRVIDEDLNVDLLRIDHLSVWGRSAARFALIWFTVGAVSCLFFLDSGLNIFTVALVVLFLALGVWVFLRTMQPVHRKIREAKAIELERVRGEIETARKTAASDAGAAARMQGLLAYEARIEAAPEWPFDQTTLFRVGASALILTVPWFGQAVAQFAIEHLAH
jgi:membrane protein implicated in regulation of membrane protease activity